jgi:hypothetical protein
MQAEGGHLPELAKSLAVAASLLSAAGDLEGAAHAFSVALARQCEPGMAVEEINIDRPAMAAAQRLRGSTATSAQNQSMPA